MTFRADGDSNQYMFVAHYNLLLPDNQTVNIFLHQTPFLRKDSNHVKREPAHEK
ncbi:hypothetical protein BSPA111_04910 [Buttiauxella sp. A111]|nr:hypothetical protein BSPA111_04910 [Buttiauxella sp. A111]